jgi:hypothetical protein
MLSIIPPHCRESEFSKEPLNMPWFELINKVKQTKVIEDLILNSLMIILNENFSEDDLRDILF